MVAYGSKGELPFTGFSRMPAGEWGWGVSVNAGEWMRDQDMRLCCTKAPRWPSRQKLVFVHSRDAAARGL